MKLTREDIVRVEDDSPLGLFKQGIKSKETADKYTRTLRQITCKVLEEGLVRNSFTRTVPMLAMGVKRFDRIPIYEQNIRVGHGQYASGPARRWLA